MSHSDKAKRMSLILELAEKDVDKAAEDFSVVKARLAAERNKLNDILEYLNTYAAENEQLGARLAPEQMIRQRAFTQQLSKAQGQQRQLIATVEREAEHKKALWQKAHLKQRAMQDLVKRMADDAQAMEDKQEEKLLDEWAQQRFAQASSQAKLH
ncbi:flagellar export protein FliJ [Marinagarivorans algicola]|uniref:flagellar export protein FliJ n=1 Tax=Marinagarivorans algicola TaxID=1513270 RepID=UPI0006B8D7B4|nr:flagellar export protein FliJ [Marinagarivorans algicola]